MEEEMELRIFDYLEGNLTEEEAAEVQHMIETSSEWNREYHLMKLTYLDAGLLSAGEQEFPNKEHLYRRERRPRVFTLYYGAAASVLLCGIAYLLWKPSDGSSAGEIASTRQPAVTPSRQEVVLPTMQRANRKNIGHVVQQLSVEHRVYKADTIPARELIATENTDRDRLLPISMYARALRTLPMSGFIPSSAAPLRFINGTYIPVQQRRSLLRYRMLEEGRELLAWVSEPKLMLVRTRREGARDRMELHLETKKMGIIATLTD